MGDQSKCPICVAEVKPHHLFCWQCKAPGPAATTEYREAWKETTRSSDPLVTQATLTPVAWFQRWYAVGALCGLGLAVAWALTSNPVTGIHINNQKADADIAAYLAAHTSRQLSVDCPSNQPANAGHIFLCPITYQGTVVANAQVTVLNGNGDIEWVIISG